MFTVVFYNKSTDNNNDNNDGTNDNSENDNDSDNNDSCNNNINDNNDKNNNETIAIILVMLVMIMVVTLVMINVIIIIILAVGSAVSLTDMQLSILTTYIGCMISHPARALHEVRSCDRRVHLFRRICVGRQRLLYSSHCNDDGDDDCLGLLLV